MTSDEIVGCLARAERLGARLELAAAAVADVTPLLREALAEVRQLRLEVDALRAERERSA